MGIHSKIYTLLLFALMVMSFNSHSSEEYCKEYLGFQMSHLKESMLENSVARVHKKLELAFMQAFAHSKGLRLSNNDEFIRLSDALKNIDKDFTSFLDHHFQYKFYKKFYKKRFSPETNLSIHDLVYRWQMFQKNNPEIFKDLDSSLLLDEWDLFAADSISQISELPLKDKPEYQTVLNKFSHPENLINNLDDFEKHFESSKLSFRKNEETFSKSIKEIISDGLNEYASVCPKEINLEETALACLANQTKTNIALQKSLMSDLSSVLRLVDMGMNKPIKKEIVPEPVIETEPVKEPEPEADPLEDLVIEKPNYKTNDGIATFCKRDPNVANTIVIHHTATSYTESAQSLNNMHLQRKTGNESWYMLGYNFLVKQDGYTGSDVSLIEGRPIDYSGSHAGGSIKPDAATLKLIKKTDVSCGSFKNGFETKKLSTKISGGKINANHTTVGISIVGNYAPKQYVRRGGVVVLENETGYDPKGGKRIPSDALLKQTAKLACSLQKKYPRLKQIKPHQFFKQTECPGTVKEYLNKIIAYAKEFSCDFLP